MLNTDIVASDIHLVLSRKSTKKANMTLDFKNNHAIIFDQSMQLMVTKSGHYAIPINPNKTILNNVTSGVNTNITLVETENNKSKNHIAIKLHRQFAHPSHEKMLKLLNSAVDTWHSDKELKKLIKKVSDECVICKIYGKTPQGPTVGLPMATSFQQCIAMDLKFYKGRILLHIIDHAARLSVSSFVKSKEPKVILKVIFKSWIQIYSASEKSLTDNGKEFANSNFIDTAESMNITAKVTAAESPFSDGLVEKHNFIIADMTDKVLEDSQHLDMDLTLP